MRFGRREYGSASKGDWVRIRSSIHSPYSGHVGMVADIDPDDTKGVYLVHFGDGMRFRYWSYEIQTISEPASIAS
jgi:hypothetical protein